MNYRQTKNTFKVLRKEWAKWSPRSRYIYNQVYQIARIIQIPKGLDLKEIYEKNYLIARVAVQANEEYECDNRRFP